MAASDDRVGNTNTNTNTAYEAPGSETFPEETADTLGDVTNKVKYYRVDGTSYEDPPSMTFTGLHFEDPPFKTYREQVGRSVDIGDLLFTAERDFLVKHDGEKVRDVDLEGKTIVLYMISLDPGHLWGVYHPDMIDAYNQMLQKGPLVEFVLVLVAPHTPVQFPTPSFNSSHDLFNHLLSTIPFPTIPFSDFEACGARVREALKAPLLPYWVVIDPSHKIVTTINLKGDLFKLFGGDELYPLTPQAIEACHRPTRSKELISKWDQLLVSPDRDFLFSSNGEKVPVSSLKGKVIGLYFCDNMPNPPRMDLIKKVYREAKRLGHKFEIVQINFHYHCFGTRYFGTDPTVEPCHENIDWLTMPFKDPRYRKLQRIFNCEHDDYWDGDCLVIVNALKADVQFEYSGAEIIQAYGVAAYPFTRGSLYETEYLRQKREVRLCSLFPPEEPLLLKSRNVNVSLLKGKKVLVLFADQSIVKAGINYFSMLKSKYNNKKTPSEDKFEVVYVATDCSESSFEEYRKRMPWFVHPYSIDFASSCTRKVFNASRLSMTAVVAFGKEGELIAKQSNIGLNGDWGKANKFPFTKHDLKTRIRAEVQVQCDLYKYCGYESDDEAALVSWNRLV